MFNTGHINVFSFAEDLLVSFLIDNNPKTPIRGLWIAGILISAVTVTPAFGVPKNWHRF